MEKTNKTVFVCNECGYESSKWLGKCPGCNSWNTFFEQKLIEKKSGIKEKGLVSNSPKALNITYDEKKHGSDFCPIRVF